MAFTTADLTAIERAMVSLSAGARIEEVRFSDMRVVKYTPANLKELRELYGFIQQQVAAANPATDPALMTGGVCYADFNHR